MALKNSKVANPGSLKRNMFCSEKPEMAKKSGMEIIRREIEMSFLDF